MPAIDQRDSDQPSPARRSRGPSIGGLFNGILARYLADAAVRRPELAPVAVGLVLASADAAWRGRADVVGGAGIRPGLAPTRP